MQFYLERIQEKMNTSSGMRALLQRVASNLDGKQESTDVNYIIMCLRQMEDSMGDVHKWAESAKSKAEWLESGEALTGILRIEEKIYVLMDIIGNTRKVLARTEK